MSGSIKGNQDFSWLDYLAKLNINPTIGIETQATGSITEEESVWVTKSDQEITRDIAALLLLPPTLSLPVFQTISLNFSNLFTINNVSASSGTLQAFGATETGITLAAAFAWAQKQNQESSLVRLMLDSVQKNPLEITLSQFVNQAEVTPINFMAIQLLLRQMPVLTAVIQTVDPTLVIKAFSLAEQQLVLSLLDQWLESIQKNAEEQRIAGDKRDIELQQTALLILKTYFEKVRKNQETLSSSVVSTIIGSLLTNNISFEAATFSSPFISALTEEGQTIPLLANIPKEAQALLGSISLGVITSATTWATPVCMTLIASTGAFSPQQLSYDAAKAYAVALSAMLMNSSFETFCSSQVKGVVTDASQGSLAIAAFRVSLLLDAMSSLYKAETGGVTGFDLLGFIKDPSSLPEDSYLRTLVTLIKESLDSLPEDESQTLLLQLTARYDQLLQGESVTEPITSFIKVWNKSLSSEAATSNPA